MHRVLSKALGDAVRDELLEHNPISRAVPLRRRRYEARVWTAEEAVRFLTAAQTDRLYAAWLVALSCGLRRGELTGLRWQDLDLERGPLSVTTQRTTDTDYQIITKAPKGTGRRKGEQVYDGCPENYRLNATKKRFGHALDTLSRCGVTL